MSPAKSRTSKKTFTVAGGTAPTAGETPRVRTARPPAAQTATTPEGPRRNSFTWRQNQEQYDALDDLARTVRRAAGRRVDRADILAVLVELTNERRDWLHELILRLDDQQEQQP